MKNEKSRLTLATKITIIRIMGIPVFVLMLLYYLEGLRAGETVDHYRFIALAFFVVIAATDALDGYIARARNEVTRLGKILDPLADKGLMLSSLILLTKPGMPELQTQFPIYFTLLVISRDVFIIIGALVIHHYSGQVEVRPRVAGKVATALLVVCVVTALLKIPQPIFLGLVGINALLILISWGQYLIDGIHQFDESHHHE